MSRYKKVITGEVELPEISGTKFLIYPTIETRMELLEQVKSSQMVEEIDKKDSTGKVIETKKIKGKFISLSDIAKTCAKMVFEGCWEHDENGVRKAKKEEEKDITEYDILNLILQSDVMSLYLECLKALDIIDKDKADEIKKVQAKAEKN